MSFLLQHFRSENELKMIEDMISSDKVFSLKFGHSNNYYSTPLRAIITTHDFITN